jgi:hypothetical protein
MGRKNMLGSTLQIIADLREHVLQLLNTLPQVSNKTFNCLGKVSVIHINTDS